MYKIRMHSHRHAAFDNCKVKTLIHKFTFFLKGGNKSGFTVFKFSHTDDYNNDAEAITVVHFVLKSKQVKTLTT